VEKIRTMQLQASVEKIRIMQLQATMRFDWLFATVSINSEVQPLAP
jgi:hypothetical protein